MKEPVSLLLLSAVVAILLLCSTSTPTVPSRFLLFSDTSSLRFLSIDDSTPKEVLSPLVNISRAKGTDYDAKTQQIYWTDDIDRSLSVEGILGVNRRVVVRGLTTPNGLAVDWVSRLLYFTDESIGVVGVATMDGRYVMPLINDLQLPRAITLDPQKGYVYWAGWGVPSRIERSYMNGAHRTVLISSGITTPIAITLDLTNRKMYWADSTLDNIQVSNLDGSSRAVLATFSGVAPYSIVFYNSALYWTDRSTNTIYRTTHGTGSLATSVYHNTSSVPYGMSLYDSSRTGGTNKCSASTHGCSQLCLPEPTRATCACAYGTVGSDGKSCQVPDQYLLIATLTAIRGVSINETGTGLKDVVEPVWLSGSSVAIAIDYNVVTKKIFYSDVGTRQIFEVSSDGSRRLVLDGIGIVDGLAVDWASDLIYYTDYTQDIIGVVHTSGSPRIGIVESGLESPRDIALDPANAMMYWTDWGLEPKIERAYMSGRGRQTLVNTDLTWPNGIALDLAARRLYWIDASLDKIESCNLDGTKRTLLLSSILIHPYSIVLYNSNLYFTEWSSSSVYRTASSGNDSINLQKSQLLRFTRPNGMVLYDKNKKAESTRCSSSPNGGCSSDRICLPEPHGVRCACSYGVSNLTTGVCEAPTLFLVFSEGSAIRGVIPSDTSLSVHEAFPPINTTGSPLAVNYNALGKRLYWTDVKKGSIKSSTFDGQIADVLTGLVDPRGLAVDWITGNVFYSDAGARLIGVVTADGVYRAVVVNISSLNEPGSMALNPTAGFMYWVDSGPTPRIDAAAMNGRSRRSIISTNIVKPAGLAIDFSGQKLYWTDTFSDKIERSNLDGSQRTLIALFSNDDLHPISLLFLNNSIFFSDQNHNGIYRFLLSSDTAYRIVRTVFTPGGIVAYDSKRTTGTNGCSSNNGGCVHLCLPDGGTGRSCACGMNRTGECLPTIVRGPQSVTAFVSTSVTLQCRVDAKGFDTTVAFVKNGATLSSRSHSLSAGYRFVTSYHTVSSVSRNDGGSYSCRASNHYGHTLSTAGVLTVANNSWCDSSPCENGGSCSDVMGSFRCTCLAGYTGPTCGDSIDECVSIPCQNGGWCWDGQDYYKCFCLRGYVGQNCETNVNECQSNPCQNGGTCTDSVNRYSCSCLPGFTGTLCQVDINECHSNPCQNGGTCIDDVNRYNCSCPAGYAGADCQMNVNECISNPCHNGASCVDAVSQYTCVCLQGYTGVLCDVNIDECASNPCWNDGDCTDGVNGYLCSCLVGFSGVYCQTNVDECASKPCTNGGVCVDKTNEFNCSCVKGFTGSHCETDVDECASIPCQNRGTCTDGIDRYTCSCLPGFTGILCETDMDECASSPCVNQATCVDKTNYYVCSCPPGYTGNRCEIELDECVSNPCRNNATCVDVVGAYSCVCPLGYTGSVCAIEVFECSSSPCQNGASCREQVGGYACECLSGFTGSNCEANIDECASNPCQNSAVCTDRVNAYTCTCAEGFAGLHCETNIDDCLSNPCQNGATCNDLRNGYLCSCLPQFTGVLCETEMFECLSNPCENSGTCSDVMDGYSCFCAAGFTGINCEKDVVECDSNPCQNGGTCKDGVNGYACACPSGYRGLDCGIINECSSLPCQNSGTCLDLEDKYTCHCASGYEGVYCEKDVRDWCASNPCQNGGVCDNALNSCRCPTDFNGLRCETDDRPVVGGHATSEGLGSIVYTVTGALGSALVIAVVIIVVLVVKRRRRRLQIENTHEMPNSRIVAMDFSNPAYAIPNEPHEVIYEEIPAETLGKSVLEFNNLYEEERHRYASVN